MFEEDSQWGTGIPDPFEDALHRNLFGKIEQDDGEAAPLDTSKKSDKKRRRKCVENMEGLGTADRHKSSEEVNERKLTTHRKRKTAKMDQVRAQQENASRTPQTELAVSNTNQTQSGGTNCTLKRRKSDGSSKLYSKMSSQLEGSRFRTINQQIYTSTGAEAKVMFDSDPELFAVYHRGFSTQVSKWPINPVDRIIAHLKTLPPSLVVCDFGCGEAKLAQSVKQRVYSFDLVAINDQVTACDMAHVPLKRHTVDVCVFCLSLMGSNLADFIREARRVLKKGGEMRICEVLSRFSSVDDFVRDVEAFGFKLLTKTEFSKMFIELVFEAVKRDTDIDLPEITLKPCVYKKR